MVRICLTGEAWLTSLDASLKEWVVRNNTATGDIKKEITEAFRSGKKIDVQFKYRDALYDGDAVVTQIRTGLIFKFDVVATGEPNAELTKPRRIWLSPSRIWLSGKAEITNPEVVGSLRKWFVVDNVVTEDIKKEITEAVYSGRKIDVGFQYRGLLYTGQAVVTLVTDGHICKFNVVGTGEPRREEREPRREGKSRLEVVSSGRISAISQIARLAGLPVPSEEEHARAVEAMQPYLPEMQAAADQQFAADFRPEEEMAECVITMPDGTVMTLKVNDVNACGPNQIKLTFVGTPKIEKVVKGERLDQDAEKKDAEKKDPGV